MFLFVVGDRFVRVLRGLVLLQPIRFIQYWGWGLEEGSWTLEHSRLQFYTGTIAHINCLKLTCVL